MANGRWISLYFAQVGAFLARFMSQVFHDGETKSFGVIMEPVVRQSRLPYRTVGWIFTWHSVICRVATPVASLLISYGYSYRFWTIVAGFLVGLGYIGLAFFLKDDICLILLVTSLTGIGHSYLVLITVICLKDSFGASFSTAYTLSNLGTNIGIAVLPLILEYFQRNYGTQEAVFIFGAFLWNNILIGVLIKSKNVHDLTENTVQQVESNKPARDLPEDRDFTFFSMFEVFTCHKRYLFILLITILEEVNFVGWAMYMVPYGESVGLPSHIAVLLSTIGGTAGFFGKLCSTLFAYIDHMHPFSVLVIPSFLVAFTYWIFILWTTFAGFAFASFLSGFLLSFQGSMNMCVINSSVCDVHFKSAMAWLMTCQTLSVVLGGVLPGYMRDVTGDFQHAFEFLLFVCLLKGTIAIAMCCCKPEKEVHAICGSA